jgi:hypothetical protein
MAFDATTLVTVYATDHPERDEWVDAEARAAAELGTGSKLTISDETYFGVWRKPWPDRRSVHIFTEAGRNRLQSFGFEYVRGKD